MDDFKSETIKSIIPIIADNGRDFIFLKKIDAICQKIEMGGNREMLIKKAKDLLGKEFLKKGICDNTASGKTEYGLEKSDRLDDLFFEIVCFDYLEKNDFLEIKFIKTSKIMKPDFEATQNGEVLYFESKYIHIPEKENHQKNLAQLDRDGIPEVFINNVENVSFLKEKIQKKFEGVFLNAKNKFEDNKIKKENRFVLYYFEPSIHSKIKGLDCYDENLLPYLKNKYNIGNIIKVSF